MYQPIDLLIYARGGNVNMVYRVAYEYDVNTCKDSSGFTALHLAVIGNHLNICRYLIERCNANINIANNDGETPLHIASARGFEDIVKYLISAGADVRIQDKKYGDTALHKSSWAHNDDISKKLLAAGASTKTLENNGLNSENLKRLEYGSVKLKDLKKMVQS